MTGAVSPFLRIAKYGLAGLAALTWLAGLALVLDRVSTRSGLFRGFDANMLSEVAVTLGLFGLAGAVLIVNARRVEAEGGTRLAFALVGVAGVLAGLCGLGFALVAAIAPLHEPMRGAVDAQLMAAAVLPLLAVFGAAGCCGAWASVSTAPPAWEQVRRWLVRSLCAAAGFAALLVAIAMVRSASAGPAIVCAPTFAALAALAGAIARRAKEPSTGDLAFAVLGYAAGAIGALVVSGVLAAWGPTPDPRAQFLTILFLWPLLLAGAMVCATSVVVVAGSFRATFGRVRRALA